MSIVQLCIWCRSRVEGIMRRWTVGALKILIEIPLGNLSWALDAQQCKCFAFRSPITIYQCVIVHPLACIYPWKPESNVAPKHFCKAQTWFSGFLCVHYRLSKLVVEREAPLIRLLLFAVITGVARYGPLCANTCWGPRERLLCVYCDFQPCRKWDIISVANSINKRIHL